MRTQIETKLLLFLSFLLVITLFSGLLYMGIVNYSNDDFYRLLKLRAITAAKIQLDKDVELEERIKMETSDDYFERFPNEKDYFFPFSASKSYRREADSLRIPQSFFRDLVKTGDAGYYDNNVFFKGIIYQSKQGPYLVIVTAANYYGAHHLSYLRKVLLTSIIISLFLSVSISLYLSRRILKPLNELTARVQQISTESLHLRVETDYKNDELRELVNTFNDMLDRIETSFETQNNFISNASHELRTPLTVIMGEADLALAKPRAQEEYTQALTAILDEAEKLEKKTQALLFLAQTGFNDKAKKFEKVRIDQLMWDVIDTVKKINPKAQIHLDLSLLPDNPLQLKVNANEQLLHLAFSNIISNACKYSDNQVVKVSIGSADNKVMIMVMDKGIGIPAEEMKHIYDPFFRASNTERYEGYGIGLPLSRNIVRMHRGELIVSSIVNKGTTVQVNLPVGNFTL